MTVPLEEKKWSKFDVTLVVIFIGVLVFASFLPLIVPGQIQYFWILIGVIWAFYWLFMLSKVGDPNIREGTTLALILYSLLYLLPSLIYEFKALPLGVQASYIIVIALGTIFSIIGIVQIAKQERQMIMSTGIVGSMFQFALSKNMIWVLVFALGLTGNVCLMLFVPVLIWTLVVIAALGVVSLILLYYVPKWHGLSIVIIFGLWIAFWNFMVIHQLFMAPLLELPILLDPIAIIPVLGVPLAIWAFGGIAILWIVGLVLTLWLRKRKEEGKLIRTILLG